MIRIVDSLAIVRHLKSIFALLCLGLLLTAPAHAEDHIVTQKNKAFTVADANIKVGDTITFRNEDTVVHNIFSLSDPMSFDLGTYAPGETRQVAFKTMGTYLIECSIHPNMKLNVHVTN